MSQTIPSPINCGSDCSGETVQIPGPAGPAGANGANGTDGIDAYTVTTAQFTMPAELANVTVNVGDSSWLTVGQQVFLQIAGYFQVVSKPSPASVAIKNLSVLVSGYYTGNAAPGTIIPNTIGVSAGGVQGATGAAGGGGDLLAANNLNDVDNAASARTNLGLGTMALETATDYLAKAGNLAGLVDVAASRVALGLGTMAVQAASAVTITGGTIAGITDLAKADGGTGASALPAFFARPGSNQAIATGAYAVVTNDNEDFDTNNNFSTATYRFTPTAAGVYALHGQVYMDTLTAGDQLRVAIYKNGTATNSNVLSIVQATYTQQLSVSALVQANGSTDYFDFRVYHNRGSNVDLLSSGTYFHGHWAG